MSPSTATSGAAPAGSGCRPDGRRQAWVGARHRLMGGWQTAAAGCASRTWLASLARHPPSVASVACRRHAALLLLLPLLLLLLLPLLPANRCRRRQCGRGAAAAAAAPPAGAPLQRLQMAAGACAAASCRLMARMGVGGGVCGVQARSPGRSVGRCAGRLLRTHDRRCGWTMCCSKRAKARSFGAAHMRLAASSSTGLRRQQRLLHRSSEHLHLSLETAEHRATPLCEFPAAAACRRSPDSLPCTLTHATRS